ncbi:hypothetical protein SEEE3402_16535 [Salmonella enterica subsp. enterica serovar Enteritidis str. 3402]|nr:hypothetical protein SEEE3402_16535 [Salmonella enterica subsp. enterica serovar Enteritidis str. 3402]
MGPTFINTFNSGIHCMELKKKFINKNVAIMIKK